MKIAIKASVLSAMLLGSSFALANNQPASYDDALIAFHKGDIQESYLLLKHVLNASPDLLPAKLLMGRILLLDGYVKEAIEELEEVLLAGGDKNLVLPPLSRAYLFDGQYDKIFAMLKRNQLVDEAHISVTLVVGTAHIRLNQTQKARALYQKALEKFPNNVALINAQSNLLLDINDNAQANELVQRALSLAPDDPLTLITQGKLNDALGEPSLAVYEKAYKLAPENPATMRAYASALAENERFNDASDIIAKIEKQTPGDVQNQLIKARILALTKQQFEADKILKSLADKLSLLTDEQLNERIELSLITGIVAYLNKNYGLASTELYRYVGKRDATAEQLSMLANSMIKTSNYKDASNLLDKYEHTVISHLPLARLYCELNLALKRSFKCDQILPELKAKYEGKENFAILKAKLLLDKNELTKARELLNTELVDSTNEEVIRLKIALLSEQENYESALLLAREILDRQPASLAHQALVTDLLIRTDNMAEAQVSIDKLLKADPANVAGLIAKARVAFYQKEWAVSVNAIETAIEQDKTNVAARILAAQIYLAHDQSEMAIDHLLAAKTLDNQDPQPRELLVAIYKDKGNLQAALSEINALLGIDRLSADYHLQKAMMLNETGDMNGAKSQLNMVYALWSDSPLQLLSLAKHQLSANDIDGAQKSFLAAIKLAPKERRTHLEYASFLIEQKRYEAATTALSTFANQFGKTANLAMLKGDLANAKEQKEEAFDNYTLALSRAPSFQLPLVKAFELAREGIKRSSLIALLEDTKDKSDSFSQHLLADLYYMNDEYAQAEQIYLNLLKNDSLPNRAFVLNNLANIYAYTKPVKAHDLIEEALSLLPRSAALMDTKGWLMTLSQDYQDGLGVLREAYTMDASDPAVQFHIAYALDKLGRSEEAKAILLKHQTLDKSFREKSHAQTLMQSL